MVAANNEYVLEKNFSPGTCAKSPFFPFSSAFCAFFGAGTYSRRGRRPEPEALKSKSESISISASIPTSRFLSLHIHIYFYLYMYVYMYIYIMKSCSPSWMRLRVSRAGRACSPSSRGQRRRGKHRPRFGRDFVLLMIEIRHHPLK